MYEFLKVLGQRAGEKMMSNPMMKLGGDIMAGNAGQGFQNFAQQQYGNQLGFGQAMMNPEATGADRIDALEQMQRRRRPMQQPQFAARPQTPLAQNAPIAMPYGQGLPGGLFSQLQR